MKNSLLPWISIVAIILIPSLLWNCGPASDTPPPPILASLSITPAGTSIAPGTTQQFSAIGIYSDSSKRPLTMSVTWSSSNTVVADVSNTPGSQGLTTATSNTGTVTITAVSGSITGSTSLTVSPLQSISVTPASSLSLAPGTTQQFTAVGNLANGATQNLMSWVTWSSSNASAATIGNQPPSQGLASALAPGSTNMTASFSGITSNPTPLTVSPVTSIAVIPVAPNIPKGTTQQFAAMATLANNATQNLTTWAAWSSSNTTIAMIGNQPGSQGLALALAVGSTTITASFSTTTSNSATLSVTPAVLVSIAATPASQSIPLGKTRQLTAMGTFTDQTTQDITTLVVWSSSNTTVGTVSNAQGSKGLFTSLSQGTTGITATYSGLTSNSAAMTVTPAELASILVSPAAASILVGGGQQFSATGIYTDNSTKDLTTQVNWVSSDPTIATISNAIGFQGVARSTSANTGSTNITASLSGITSNPATLTVHF